MVHEGTKRRRRLLSWLPATVLAIIIVAVAIFVASLSASQVGTQPTAVPIGARNDLGASVYTPSGQAFIEASREIIVDARQPPVDATGLGLARRQTFTLDPSEDVYASLVVHGPSGVLTFHATVVTVSSTGGVLSAATAVDESVALSFSNTRALFIERAGAWGVDAGEADGFTAAAAAASASDGSYQWTMVAPDAIGLRVEMTAHCSSGGRCVLDYAVTLG